MKKPPKISHHRSRIGYPVVNVERIGEAQRRKCGWRGTKKKMWIERVDEEERRETWAQKA